MKLYVSVWLCQWLSFVLYISPSGYLHEMTLQCDAPVTTFHIQKENIVAHHIPCIPCMFQEQWGKLAPAWEKFNDNQLAQLKSFLSSNWDKLVRKMSNADLAAMSTAMQEKLNIIPQIVDRLKRFNLKDVADWTKEQWDRIPFDNLMPMDWSVLREVPTTEVEKWTKVRKCDHVVCRLVC